MPAARDAVRITDLRDAPQHLARVAAWHEQQWHSVSPPVSRAQREQRLHAHLNPAPLPSTWLAMTEQTPVGCVSLVDYRWRSVGSPQPWLANLYVEPAHRGQGIGRELVEHVCQFTRRQGYPLIYLFTPDHTDWYRHLGWQWCRQARVQGQWVDVLARAL